MSMVIGSRIARTLAFVSPYVSFFNYALGIGLISYEMYQLYRSYTDDQARQAYDEITEIMIRRRPDLQSTWPRVDEASSCNQSSNHTEGLDNDTDAPVESPSVTAPTNSTTSEHFPSTIEPRHSDNVNDNDAHEEHDLIMSRDEAIDRFRMISDVDHARARGLLEACDWNLELAINMHVDMDEMDEKSHSTSVSEDSQTPGKVTKLQETLEIVETVPTAPQADTRRNIDDDQEHQIDQPNQDTASLSTSSSEHCEEVSDVYRQCYICALTLSDPDKSVATLPYCMHPFHKKCLDGVLRFHPRCPICDVHVFTTI